MVSLNYVTENILNTILGVLFIFLFTIFTVYILVNLLDIFTFCLQGGSLSFKI